MFINRIKTNSVNQVSVSFKGHNIIENDFGEKMYKFFLPKVYFNKAQIKLKKFSIDSNGNIDESIVHEEKVRDIPKDAEEIGRKVLKGFDIRAKFFHLEFLRRKSDNKLFTLEMNCRAPGGYTLDLINYANDIDVFQEWANIVAFNEFKAQFERKYYAAHIAKRNGKSYRHDNDEIFAKYGDKIAAYIIVPPIFADVMGDEAFLVRSPEEQDIKEMISFIQEQY